MVNHEHQPFQILALAGLLTFLVVWGHSHYEEWKLVQVYQEKKDKDSLYNLIEFRQGISKEILEKTDDGWIEYGFGRYYPDYYD